MKSAWLGLLRRLLSAPVAPFHEQFVAQEIRVWAAHRGLAVRTDPAGNLLLDYRHGGRRPTWVFAAHMDHPGFVAQRQLGPRRLEARFFGSVDKKYFLGAAVRFFTPVGEVVGRVSSSRAVKDTPWRQCRIIFPRAVEIPPGTLGMWNIRGMGVSPMRPTDVSPVVLPSAHGRTLAAVAPGGILRAVSCDDVAGCAAVLSAFGEIVSRQIPANVTCLLTRAEEAAFIGALAACRHRTLPKNAYVVAIETSKAQPQAPLGCGVIVRVGDRVRTFDPSLTAHVAAVAEALAKHDRRFRHTRQLMPGGTCESTAYAMLGYRATGLCIPLGNYHNQGPGRRVAAEEIDLDDFANLVKLLVALAADRGGPRQTDAKLLARLRHLLASRGKYLTVTEDSA